MALRAILLVCATLTSCVLAGCPLAQEQKCGTQPYCPGEYTCYSSNRLCPKMEGVVYQACGSDPYACYDPYRFDCVDEKLKEKPKDTLPYTLNVAGSSSPSLVGYKVQACGQAFYATASNVKPCTYCPGIVVEDGGTCPKGDETVLLGGFALWTEVPGGQEFYVSPYGQLGFTQAHSGSYPPGSVFGVDAYEGGVFSLKGTSGWVACVSTSAAHGPPIPGQEIFAKFPGTTWDPVLCPDVELVTVDWTRKDYGAWEYT